MREAIEYYLNHPPGIKVVEPIKIAFFKKEACDNPTDQGSSCTVTVQVSSRNMLAQMFNKSAHLVMYFDKTPPQLAANAARLHYSERS